MRVHELPLALAALALVTAPVFAAEPAAVPAPAPAPSPPPPPAADGGAARDRAELDRQLAEARRRLEDASRDVARLSSQLGRDMGDRLIRYRFEAPPRALLGVQVGGDEPDARGARVIAVSPGGAAEKAGIRAGDVITHIGGTELRRDGEPPSRALVARARELEPEKPVELRFLRDGKSREVQVTPHAAPRGPGGPDRFFRFDGPPGDIRAPVPMVRPFGGPGPDDGPGPGRDWERGVPPSGMELATLSEGLGRYFGAKQGVLVVRAGANDAYKLQDGDVILSIDGREPTSASHATRILRSYQRGEKLQMKVLRDRRTVTLEVTLPGG